MPGRSSSDDGSLKVSRNPRVAAEWAKGWEDGVQTPRARNKCVGRGQREAIVATEGSNGSSGGVRTGKSNRIGSRKLESRGHGSDAAPYHSANGRSSDTHGRGKRDWKTKSGIEGLEPVVGGNLGLKRKRISADPEIVELGMSDGNNRRSRSQYKAAVLNSCMNSKKKLSRQNDYEFADSSRNKRVTKIRKSSRSESLGNDYEFKGSCRNKGVMESRKFRGSESLGRDCESKDSSKNTSVTESGKFKGSESLNKRGQNSKIGRADKPKYVTDNGLGNVKVKSKISDNRKAPLTTQKEFDQRREAPVKKHYNRKDHKMMALIDGSDISKAPTKKKKRGIRIDPYDTSNKRLDDCISGKG